MKPYVLVILGIVVLTFLQVQSELALPDYMSNIVTNGIQYGGITESSPVIITETDMNKILLFTKDDEKILKSYELLKEGDSVLVKNKKVVFKENVYHQINNEADSLMENPLVYSYISEVQGIEINESNYDKVLPEHAL